MDHGAREEGGLFFWIMMPFTSCGWLGGCRSFTRAIEASRTQYGYKARQRRQCAVYKLKQWKNCIYKILLQTKYSLSDQFVTLQNIWKKPFRKGFEELGKEFKVLTRPPNSPDLNLWDVLDQKVWSMEANSELTALKVSALTPWCMWSPCPDSLELFWWHRAADYILLAHQCTLYFCLLC